MRLSLPRLCALLWLGLSPAPATAAGWPENYVVAEDSTSPNGQYAVLIPTADADDQWETNYLVDLKEKKLLGKIRGAGYFERSPRLGLAVLWADDSTWCAVEYDERWGFSGLSILEPTKHGFTQTEIGERITKACDAAMAKEQRHPTGGYANLYENVTADRQVKVNALSFTNPKGLDDKSFYALFRGSYDLKSKKWTSAVARALSQDDFDSLKLAFEYDAGDALESLKTIEREADQASHLDELLNQMYQALRILLPADRFVTLKQEQIAWLKTRDAEQSAPTKLKLIAARIDALSKLLP